MDLNKAWYEDETGMPPTAEQVTPTMWYKEKYGNNLPQENRIQVVDDDISTHL